MKAYLRQENHFYKYILARIVLTANYYKQSPGFLIKIQNVGSPT